MTVTGSPPATAGTRPPRPRRGGLARREERAGFALIAPTVAVIALVALFPLVWALSLSLQQIRLIDIGGVGILGDFTVANYVDVLTAPGFWEAMWTTTVYTLGSTLGSLAVGLAVALALRPRFRGRSAVRGLVLLPYVAPVVAVTFVWTVLLSPQFGLVNHWGQRLLGWDEPIPFLSQSSTALATVIAFEIWRYFPFAFLFLTARLQAVPRDMEEAALVDGATPLQKFRYILLPQLIPTLGVLFVLRAIFTFNKFDDVYLLTGGGAGTEIISVRVYEFLTARNDVGAAAAQAVVLAVILAAFIALQLRLMRGRGEVSA
ncbi:MAG: carbohydrate ABC transporter permease [Kineosporiaceae bacterium]